LQCEQRRSSGGNYQAHIGELAWHPPQKRPEEDSALSRAYILACCCAPAPFISPSNSRTAALKRVFGASGPCSHEKPQQHAGVEMLLLLLLLLLPVR
jgi:hypothetical protein